METVKIAGELREKLGKKASKSARKEGKIPAVMYGGNDVVHFSTTNSELKSVVYTPDFKMVELDLNGETFKCILKDIQFHPVTDNIEHVDFLRLYDDVSVNIEVPIKFIGNSPGVLEGGKLIQTVRKIKLKTIPQNIVNSVTVDISELKLGSAVRVKEIAAMDKVQIMNPPNMPVANVEIPRALRSATDMAESDAVAEEATAAE